jgi:hypothetical protein
MYRTLLGVAMFTAALLAGTAAAQERGSIGTVTLTRTDYDRLLDLAAGRTPDAERAPVPAALTRADLRVRVSGNVARATIAVDGEVFHSGVVKVPLLSGATLLDARLADRPLPIASDGATHAALIAGPSTFTATLEWATPLTIVPGRGSFVLPVPAAGSATAVVDVPGEMSDVRVNPGLVLRRTSAGGRTTIEVALDPGTAAQVTWSARETSSTPQAREIRMLSDVKTLVTIGEADLRLLSVLDVTVVQGEPATIDIGLPGGYELSSVSGTTVERTQESPGRVQIVLSNPALRRHQFVLGLERPHGGGSFKLDTGLPSVPAAQRETGEVALEGIGTLEVAAADVPGLRRIDVRETDPVLSASPRPLLAAYRYQRAAGGPPALVLDVTRFADAAVLAAVADRAVVTTLVTSEGRALTEVSLRVRNRAQPFVRVVLPPGASMLSVDVAGQTAKPAAGSDGTRVPLLRPGFRPTGAYTVSFVYVHSGTAFANKGDMQMLLPKMDLPITVVEWELFVPDRYRADRFGGNAIPAQLVNMDGAVPSVATGLSDRDVRVVAGTGTIAGRVVDSSGAPLPGATIVAQSGGQTRTAVTNGDGQYTLGGLPSGPMTVTGQLSGFRSVQHSLVFDQRARQLDFAMEIGALTETITVMSETNEDQTRDKVVRQAPSVNVQNLQRRASGILPVRIDIPRAGTSHRFVKPLVIDEETVVSFRYRQRR